MASSSMALAPQLLSMLVLASCALPAAATTTMGSMPSVTLTLDFSSPWTWTAAALLLALIVANSKNLPFAWHARIFHALFVHRSPPPLSARPTLLFQPVLNRTTTPLTDCDYNMHKGNSTYFADLDLARVHLLGALGFGAQPKGSAMPALGGVSCNFRRPVAPLQPLCIYTRVLSWDQKWFYIASWIVKDQAKAAKPHSWTLQPWRNSKLATTDGGTSKAPEVCAVSIARYVFKKGRLTVAPHEVLKTMGLLPAANSPTEKTDGFSAVSTVTAAAVEAQRLQGMEVAQTMTTLDGILEDLHPSDGPALGLW